MTILELQKELQVMYEKHGDIGVVIEEKDWLDTETEHYGIFGVEEVSIDGATVVALLDG